MTQETATGLPLAPARSTDGQFWWDGSAWRPMAASGLYYWDGARWVVIPSSVVELSRHILGAVRWAAFMLTLVALFVTLTYFGVLPRHP
jgi:hypothetical protein